MAHGGQEHVFLRPEIMMGKGRRHACPFGNLADGDVNEPVRPISKIVALTRASLRIGSIPSFGIGAAPENACQTVSARSLLTRQSTKNCREFPMTVRSTLLTTAVTFALAGSAFAEGCDTVIFSDVGWTDITATTAATTLVLEALGYETETKVLSVPVTYTGLAEGDIDVFLGNWMPTMEADIAPYRDAGTVETIRTNLEGAKYTSGDQRGGCRTRDHRLRPIAAQKDALEGKIYGIEPGNDGNRLIIDMIASGPSGWTGSRSSKARNRGCWPKSRRRPRMAARSCSLAGNRTR
jgi:hypothetical protein